MDARGSQVSQSLLTWSKSEPSFLPVFWWQAGTQQWMSAGYTQRVSERHEAVSEQHEAPALLRVHPALTAPGDPAGTLLGQPSAFWLGTHMVIWARGLSSY
jgi:hypothetical protein